jgi:hypothetical protein
MSSPIRIESSPISISDVCHSISGQSILFTVISGITSSSVSCEWFLNGNSVYVGSSYILLSPHTNDEVYARVINCSGSTGLKIGDWIEDIMFYYNDVPAGVKTYYIDLKASFNYKILSIVLKSDNVSTTQITIDDVPIVWTNSGTSINITNTISDTEAIRSNNVSIGQKVKLLTNGTNVIRGKVRFRRIMANSLSPSLTTTSTTTTSTTSTTSTSTSTTSTTTTTPSPILASVAIVNNSTDMSVGNVIVGGGSLSSAVYPVNPGGGSTIGYTPNIGSFVNVSVIFSASMAGQNISITDSNGDIQCWDYDGVHTSHIFAGIALDSITTVIIYLSNGSCV